MKSGQTFSNNFERPSPSVHIAWRLATFLSNNELVLRTIKKMQSNIVFKQKFLSNLDKTHRLHVFTCYLCNCDVKNVCNISNIVPCLVFPCYSYSQFLNPNFALLAMSKLSHLYVSATGHKI
jgi:hypothetical protein